MNEPIHRASNPNYMRRNYVSNFAGYITSFGGRALCGFLSAPTPTELEVLVLRCRPGESLAAALAGETLRQSALLAQMPLIIAEGGKGAAFAAVLPTSDRAFGVTASPSFNSLGGRR